IPGDLHRSCRAGSGKGEDAALLLPVLPYLPDLELDRALRLRLRDVPQRDDRALRALIEARPDLGEEDVAGVNLEAAASVAPFAVGGDEIQDVLALVELPGVERVVQFCPGDARGLQIVDQQRDPGDTAALVVRRADADGQLPGDVLAVDEAAHVDAG